MILHGISGNMFSGKTEELIRLTTRAEIAKKHVLVFKPRLDNRWGLQECIQSHSHAQHFAYAVDNPQHLKHIFSEALYERSVDVVAIDEIQFFDETIVEVIQNILKRGTDVIFAGLPLNFRGEPFGAMPTLLAYSDQITRLTAICDFEVGGSQCNKDATRTQRLVNGKPAHYDDPLILIGGQESYAARCPLHHYVPGKD